LIRALIWGGSAGRRGGAIVTARPAAVSAEPPDSALYRPSAKASQKAIS